MSDSCDGSAGANVNVADESRVGRRSKEREQSNLMLLAWILSMQDESGELGSMLDISYEESYVDVPGVNFWTDPKALVEGYKEIADFLQKEVIERMFTKLLNVIKGHEVFETHFKSSDIDVRKFLNCNAFLDPQKSDFGFDASICGGTLQTFAYMRFMEIPLISRRGVNEIFYKHISGVIDLDVKASSGIPEKHYVVDEVHKFVDEFFEVIGHEDFAEMYKVGCYYQQGYFELSPVQFLHLYKNKLKEESDFDNVIMASSHVYAKSIVKDAYHIVENFGMMSKKIRLDVPLDTHLTNEGIKVILTDLVEGRDYAKHRGIIFMKAFDRDLRFLEEKQTE
jgi:hypothetical protein